MVPVNRHPSLRELRQFGLIWLVFFATAGVVALVRSGSTTAAAVLWAAAVAVPVLGWVVPSFMRAIFVGMSLAAWPIGFAVSHLVLAVVYYLVVTPAGLLLRLFRYDPMQRRLDPEAESYWQVRERPTDDERRYFRQF